jgi:hypothetical protein
LPERYETGSRASRRGNHDLVALGVQSVTEIPAGLPLQPIQQRVKDDVEWIGRRLRAALEMVESPVHHS